MSANEKFCSSRCISMTLRLCAAPVACQCVHAVSRECWEMSQLWDGSPALRSLGRSESERSNYRICIIKDYQPQTEVKALSSIIHNIHACKCSCSVFTSVHVHYYHPNAQTTAFVSEREIIDESHKMMIMTVFRLYWFWLINYSNEWSLMNEYMNDISKYNIIYY